jgi:alcohol dehydrogenase, propanol-preferring
MKAAVLHEFKKPLGIEDVPRPQLAADEVLIEVDACGVCHSDLHVAEGDWKQFAGIVKRPLILGHEIAGRVKETGTAVHDLKIGDRVGVPWLYWSCGECEFCCQGDENLCVKQGITGVTVDGGFAEFMKVRASHATRIPDGLSAIEAAPLFCAGVTVHRALKHAKILPGQRVAILGIGGLGHIAIQLARALGAEIIAIDVGESKLEMAHALGAAKTLNAATANVAKEFRSSGGAHVALVTSGAKAAYDAAFASLRATGTLLVVGLPAEDICFPPIMMAAREVRIRASAVGTREDLREVLALAAAGKVRCEVTARPLADVNAVFEEMRRREISGRVVLTPPGSK